MNNTDSERQEILEIMKKAALKMKHLHIGAVFDLSS